MSIGIRMRAFRDSLGMTREEFAERYGISASTLSGYERDQRAPHAEGLAVFAKAGANINWILTGEGSMSVSGQIYQPGDQSRLQLAAEATPAVVDMVLLQKVTDFLFQWQADHNTRLDQDKIGAIIAILYRIAASSGKVRKAELEQVLAIAA